MTKRIPEKKKEIKCPWCGRKKAVEKHKDDKNVYHCKYCNKLFEIEE